MFTENIKDDLCTLVYILVVSVVNVDGIYFCFVCSVCFVHVTIFQYVLGKKAKR